MRITKLIKVTVSRWFAAYYCCQAQFNRTLVTCMLHVISGTIAGLLFAIHVYLPPKAGQLWIFDTPTVVALLHLLHPSPCYSALWATCEPGPQDAS